MQNANPCKPNAAGMICKSAIGQMNRWTCRDDDRSLSVEAARQVVGRRGEGQLTCGFDTALTHDRRAGRQHRLADQTLAHCPERVTRFKTTHVFVTRMDPEVRISAKARESAQREIKLTRRTNAHAMMGTLLALAGAPVRRRSQDIVGRSEIAMTACDRALTGGLSTEMMAMLSRFWMLTGHILSLS